MLPSGVCFLPQAGPWRSNWILSGRYAELSGNSCQIISYQCCLDLLTGNYLNESTDEYFYKDVVSIATKTESKTYSSDKFGDVQLNAAETFVLTTSGGTSIEMVLRDPKLIEMMGGGNIPTTEAERAIQVVRKMLREKKQD